jgi:hypothetical protein
MVVDADTDAAINLCAMYVDRRRDGGAAALTMLDCSKRPSVFAGVAGAVVVAARIGKNRRGRRPEVGRSGRFRPPSPSLTGRLAAAAPRARLRNGAMVSGMVGYQRSARTTSLPETLGCDAPFSLKPGLP